MACRREAVAACCQPTILAVCPGARSPAIERAQGNCVTPFETHSSVSLAALRHPFADRSFVIRPNEPHWRGSHSIERSLGGMGRCCAVHEADRGLSRCMLITSVLSQWLPGAGPAHVGMGPSHER